MCKTLFYCSGFYMKISIRLYVMCMNLKRNFGQNVKKYRKLKNLTQEQLAERVGVDSTSICSVENGKYFPTAENISKIAAALNINISDLFYFENLVTPEDNYNSIINLIDMFKDDSVRLNAVKNFLQSLV